MRVFVCVCVCVSRFITPARLSGEMFVKFWKDVGSPTESTAVGPLAVKGGELGGYLTAFFNMHLPGGGLVSVFVCASVCVSVCVCECVCVCVYMRVNSRVYVRVCVRRSV